MASLTDNALHVLSRRYLLRDEDGAVVETPEALFRRVARAVAAAEPPAERDRAAERFEARMAALEFLPNSPTLMNAGRPHGQLAACFVLPVEDDLAAIFDALKWAALIHQSGGGTGFAFSRLRPRGDVVKTTHGVASGPVSFMRVYDARDRDHQAGRRPARREHGGPLRRAPGRPRVRRREARPRARELQPLGGRARRALPRRGSRRAVAAQTPAQRRRRSDDRRARAPRPDRARRRGRAGSPGSCSSIASRRPTRRRTSGTSRR